MVLLGIDLKVCRQRILDLLFLKMKDPTESLKTHEFLGKSLLSEDPLISLAGCEFNVQNKESCPRSHSQLVFDN